MIITTWARVSFYNGLGCRLTLSAGEDASADMAGEACKVR